jgi:hypothetical protein
MAKNPFGKSRPATQPYAIYRAGDMVWHVCKTYKQPKNETGDLYARWFVWAKSPMTHGVIRRWRHLCQRNQELRALGRCGT